MVEIILDIKCSIVIEFIAAVEDGRDMREHERNIINGSLNDCRFGNLSIGIDH